MVAPSREAAQPLLARLHTGRPKKAWLREQQAIFFYAQLDRTTTVDDLRVAFPAQAKEMARFIAMGEMRGLIRGMKYKDPGLRTFVLDSELKMTAFEYVYRPKKLRAALGLEFDSDGLLVKKTLSNGQKKAITYILERLKEKSLNTRSPELIASRSEQAPFIAILESLVAGDGLPADRPGNGVSPNPSGDDSAERTANAESRRAVSADRPVGKSEGDSAEARAGNGPRGSNRGDTKTRLDFEGFEYMGGSAGMRRRFEELKTLNVHDFPNAAYDLMRTVLECSIKDYFRATGNTAIEPRMTLGPIVNLLADEFSSDNRMTGLISSIKRRGRMTSEQQSGTAEALNHSNHEPDQIAEGRDVHAGWDKLKPILSEIVGPARHHK